MISGVYTRRDGAFIPANVYLPEPISRSIAFPLLVDPGASWTTLNARDLGRFGVQTGELGTQPSPIRLVGIGGAVDAWTIPAVIVFAHDDGGVSSIGLHIALSDDPTLALPSILGRDVLALGRTDFDGPSETVFLDLPKRRDLIARAPWAN